MKTDANGKKPLANGTAGKEAALRDLAPKRNPKGGVITKELDESTKGPTKP
jgi:hypothetical protein